jgi:hypothetical protein
MSYNPTIDKFILEQVIGYSAPQVIPIKLISTGLPTNPPTPIAVYFVTSASDGSGGFEIYNTVQRVSESDFYTDASGHMVINASLQFIMENGAPMIIPRNTEYNCIAYVQFNNSQTSYYSDDTPITSGPSKPVISDIDNMNQSVKVYLDLSGQPTELVQEYTVVLSYTNLSGNAVVEPRQDLILDLSDNSIIVDGLNNDLPYWLVVIANGNYGNSEVSDVIEVDPTARPLAPTSVNAWGSYDGNSDIQVSFEAGANWTTTAGPYAIYVTANGNTYQVGQIDLNNSVPTPYVVTLNAGAYGFSAGSLYNIEIYASNGDGDGNSSTVNNVLCFETPHQPDIQTLVAGNGTLDGTFFEPDNNTGGVDASASVFIVELYAGADASGAVLDTITVPCTDASSYNFQFIGPLDMSANYTVRVYENIHVPSDFSGFPTTDLSGNPVAVYPVDGIVTGASDYDSLWLNIVPADPPTDFSGNAGDTFVDLSWVAPAYMGTGDFYGYRIGVYSDPNLINQVGGFIDISGNITSYTVNGLTNDTIYYFIVQTITEDHAGDLYYSADSLIVVATPFVDAPLLPEALFLSAGDTFIDATWAAASAGTHPVTSYEYKIDSGSWVDNGLDLSVTLSGLTNDQSYTVYVRAVSAGPTQTFSNEIFASATPFVDAPVLPEPLTLSAGDTFIDASWPAATDGTHPVTSYEYKIDSGSWVDNGLNTSATLSGLTNDQSYTVYVRAVSAGPSQTFSNEIQASATPFVDAPVLPEPLTLTAGDTFIDASWSDASAGTHPVTSYEYKIDSGSWVDNGLNTSVTLSGLTNNQSYTIYVRAVSAGPSQTFSNEISASATPFVDAPVLPDALILVPGDTFIQASWLDASAGTHAITQYEYKVFDGSTVIIDWTSNGLSNEVLITGLTNGTSYRVYVRAYSAGPSATYSNEIFNDATPTVTPPSNPLNLQAEPRNNSMILSWDQPSDLGTYGVISYYQCQVLDHSNNEIVYPTDFSGFDASGWFTISLDGSPSYSVLLTGLVNIHTYVFTVRAVTADQPNQYTNPLYGVSDNVVKSPSGLPLFTDVSGNVLVDASGNVDTNGAVVLTVSDTVATAYILGNGSHLTNYTLVVQDLSGIIHKYRTGGDDGYPRPEPDVNTGIYTIIFDSINNPNIPDAGYTMVSVLLVVSNTTGQEFGTTLQ